MLMSITTAQRLQTLHMLNIGLMKIEPLCLVFCFDTPLKQSTPRQAMKPVILKAYAPDKRLCVYNVMLEYLKRTELLRGNEEQLLISYQKPFKKVSRDTISRWIKRVMTMSGLYLDQFKAHSTRSASTSAAQRALVPMQDILDRAGWSSAQTFAAYYEKKIVVPESDVYAEAVLSSCSKLNI